MRSLGAHLRAVIEREVAAEVRFLDGTEARFRLHDETKRLRRAVDGCAFGSRRAGFVIYDVPGERGFLQSASRRSPRDERIGRDPPRRRLPFGWDIDLHAFGRREVRDGLAI